MSTGFTATLNLALAHSIQQEGCSISYIWWNRGDCDKQCVLYMEVMLSWFVGSLVTLCRLSPITNVSKIARAAALCAKGTSQYLLHLKFRVALKVELRLMACHPALQDDCSSYPSHKLNREAIVNIFLQYEVSTPVAEHHQNSQRWAHKGRRGRLGWRLRHSDRVPAVLARCLELEPKALPPSRI